MACGACGGCDVATTVHDNIVCACSILLELRCYLLVLLPQIGAGESWLLAHLCAPGMQQPFGKPKELPSVSGCGRAQRYQRERLRSPQTQ